MRHIRFIVLVFIVSLSFGGVARAKPQDPDLAVNHYTVGSATMHIDFTIVESDHSSIHTQMDFSASGGTGTASKDDPFNGGVIVPTHGTLHQTLSGRNVSCDKSVDFSNPIDIEWSVVDGKVRASWQFADTTHDPVACSQLSTSLVPLAGAQIDGSVTWQTPTADVIRKGGSFSMTESGSDATYGLKYTFMAALVSLDSARDSSSTSTRARP